jgi:hypothetical protein
VPWLAVVAAGLLALPAAVAVMPKAAADGVLLAGPIFDHSKIAMIDEMARLGLPPGNPFLGDSSDPRLVYYYLWHFSAAEIAASTGVSGWEADIALTWVTAFASLVLMMGLAVRFVGRSAAAWWVAPLALAASLRPVLGLIWRDDTLDAVLLPSTGFAGWLFQSAWVPQHLMSATAIVAAVTLMGRLGERSLLRIVVVGLMVAAAFESSTWIGGVTFALAAPAIGTALLAYAAPADRVSLAASLAAAALHESAPVTLTPYQVLGARFGPELRRVLDLPAFWLVFLVVELPAIYLTGAVALAGSLRSKATEQATRRDALALALLAIVGLGVAWLLASTLGENDDLGWRAVLPAVLALTVFAAAGLARWVAARAWLPAAAALVAIALGLPRSVEIIRDNAIGHPQPDAAAFAQAPEMWDAMRRHSIADERVGNNPRALATVTPWPINIGWALLSDRRSCYAGREFAQVFTALSRAKRDEIDALFTRVFDGTGSADDVRELASTYGCRAVAVTAQDGAWTHDPFAMSPFYRLVERKDGRWRIYRNIAPGDGGYRP